MGKIMQTRSWEENYQSSVALQNVGSDEFFETDSGRISYDQALKEEMIEVEQVENVDGIPQVKVTNNSSWKILLFSADEMIGKGKNRLLSIQITLEQNVAAVIPAFFLASTYFYDQGMVSIQEYLHHFKAMDQQAGVTYTRNGKVMGKRFGNFPIKVEVSYTHYPLHLVIHGNKMH